MGGLDDFTGSLGFFLHEFLEIDNTVPSNVVANWNSPYRATSVYARDYWRISPQLIAELGISGDNYLKFPRFFP